jgi:hypothetical protein
MSLVRSSIVKEVGGPLETVFCTACGHQMANDFRFCSKCGEPNRAVITDGVPAAVPSTAPKPAVSEAKTLQDSIEEPSTGNNRSLVLWVTGLIVVFLVVVAILAQIGSQSRDAATSSSQSSPAADWSSEPFQVPEVTNDETIAACKYLGPVVEEVLEESLTSNQRTREAAMARLLLAINDTRRQFDVEGYANTTVPMPLTEFSRATETLLVFDESTLTLTRFVDAMSAGVIEPCGEVGILVRFPESRD